MNEPRFSILCKTRSFSLESRTSNPSPLPIPNLKVSCPFKYPSRSATVICRDFAFVRREAKAETRAFCKDSGLMSKENEALACKTVGKLSTVPSDGSSSRIVGNRAWHSLPYHFKQQL